jgi:adenine-specific DNA-methyltransferase
LAGNTRILQLIDFGDAQVFTAISYPTIVILQRTVPSTEDKPNEIRAFNWQPGPPIEEFAELFQKQSIGLSQAGLKSDGWRLESNVKLKLLERIRAAGTPLLEYVKGRFYYGIKTGLNKAFVIDRATRDRLIAEHPSSSEILSPFLRGRDVKRWRVEFAEQYLIKIESSENKQHPWSHKSIDQAEKTFRKTYPGIYKHFEPYRKGLIERYDQGSYFWELRSCDYWTEFQQPKVVFTRFVDRPIFAYEDNGYYLNNALWIIPRVSSALVALLNSPIAWWFLKQSATDLQGGYLQISRENLALLGIPPLPAKSEESICHIECYLRLLSRVKEGEGKSAERNLSVFEFLETLLNGLIYELFFPDELHSQKVNLFKQLEEAAFPALADIPEKQRFPRLEEIYEQISDDLHPIRGCLESLKSLEVVRIIEGGE